MKEIILNNVNEVLLEIKNRFYNREFASILGMSYFVDEPMGDYIFIFAEELDKYSFLFYFFDIEQGKMEKKDFETLIDKMILLSNTCNEPIKFKGILFEKELLQLKEKKIKGLITDEVYNQQINKILS